MLGARGLDELAVELYDRGKDLPPAARILDIGTSRIFKSGMWSPYLVNFRPVLSYDARSEVSREKQLETRNSLLKEYGVRLQSLEAISGEKIDHIFGPAEAGTPLAAAIGGLCGFSVLWERVANKESFGSHQTLEGILLPGQRVVVIDDVVTTGLTKREGREMIQAANGIADDVVVGFDRCQGGREAVLDMGMTFSSVLNAYDVFAALYDNDRLTAGECDFLIEYTTSAPIFEEPAIHPWKAT